VDISDQTEKQDVNFEDDDDIRACLSDTGEMKSSLSGASDD